MTRADYSHKLALASLALISALSIFILFYFNGIGAEADSFHHYLLAHFAIEYPIHFFDHWGKPLYTLLSSPFAQFGIMGSKVFNLICSVATLWFAFKLAKVFKLDQAPLVIFIIFLIPLNFQVNFSAFTEPLFALMLISGIWLILQKRWLFSLLLISFLPMARSEGILILGVVSIYLIYKRQHKRLPLLLVGQLAYGLGGWIYLGRTPFWTFSQIPYASLNSPYGSGDFLHFAEKLYLICGIPLLILFIIGFISSLIHFKKHSSEWNILIMGSFLVFFLFHSIAWSLGWFNSMGLKRVFGAITPIMGIIMLNGLNQLLSYSKKSFWKDWLGVSWIVISIAFLFTNGPAAVDWQHEMNLSPSQRLADRVGNYIVERKIPYNRLVYSDRYLQNSLQNDLYDYHEYWPLDEEILNKFDIGDLVIWDSWHAPTDFGIELKELKSRPELEEIKEFKIRHNNQEVQYVIFLTKE